MGEGWREGRWWILEQDVCAVLRASPRGGAQMQQLEVGLAHCGQLVTAVQGDGVAQG